MRFRIFIFIFCLATLPVIAGNAKYRPHTRTMNSHGLYGDKYYRAIITTPHAFVIRFSPNYLASDVELPGNALGGYKDGVKQYTRGDQSGAAANVGGDIAFSYTYRANPYISIRPELIVGYMRGYCNFYRETTRSNGEVLQSHYERQLRSCLLEYTIGMEFYPSVQAGFFFYVGFGGATSFIHRKFNPYLIAEGIPLGVDDKVTCTTPVIPVGAGYKWRVRNCVFGLDIIWHPALLDGPGVNMDGWQSGKIYNGQPYFPNQNSSNRWSDSYLELGFSVGGVF